MRKNIGGNHNALRGQILISPGSGWECSVRPQQCEGREAITDGFRGDPSITSTRIL